MKPRDLPVNVDESRAERIETGAQLLEFTRRPPNPLTLHRRSVALDDNVRDLLDWLIDEELKRWQRER